MKSNVIKLSDTLKYSVDKTAIVVHQNIEGVDELCCEISKYVSILTISVKIINYALCECAANQLLKVCIDLFDALYKLFAYIHNNANTKTSDTAQNDADDQKTLIVDANDRNLTTLVGVIWEHLKLLKSVPLDNVTSTGRQIMSTLSIIRDAKKEIKQSIKEMESNECIIKVDPWKYDYSKLPAMMQSNTTQNPPHQNAQTALASNNHNNETNDDDDHKDNDDDAVLFDDDDDLLCLGMEEEELTELQSLRVYQIYECVVLVDEVVHHIYLFIIKHFKESVHDLDAHKKWLSAMTQAIQLLPRYVDELSCCIYSPQPADSKICEHASNLLHYLWKVAIEIAEQCTQYKTRKMVIKNKRKKSKMAVTGYEWKCKFVDYNLRMGQMFGLLSMQHIEAFVENDSNYNPDEKNRREKKKKRVHGHGHQGHGRKHAKQQRKKKEKRKHKQSSSKDSKSNTEMSASSQKDAEEVEWYEHTAITPQPKQSMLVDGYDNEDEEERIIVEAMKNVQLQKNDEDDNNDDMIDID
eukprot:CAMPEP_0197028472 /NCGR_PEP_ID=MMETSP1384-20130603/8147_1 /TAXON_ID=29189 /ORGANISM="Ammonia sp." /LENGTH=523 /DNA_ID=CAMNT_0042457481 /DNA_START=45 /DNA_END=1616 /DNA_ORIENTATION=+